MRPALQWPQIASRVPPCFRGLLSRCARTGTATIALPFCHVTLRGQKPPDLAYPKELRTFGDHIRKRRLDLGLLQRQLAERIGVHPGTVRNWETNATTVALKHVPAVVEFLGYAPFPEPASLAERIRLYRWQNGISRRELARRLRADETTVWRWEAGLGKPGSSPASTTFVPQRQSHFPIGLMCCSWLEVLPLDPPVLPCSVRVPLGARREPGGRPESTKRRARPLPAS